MTNEDYKTRKEEISRIYREKQAKLDSRSAKYGFIPGMATLILGAVITPFSMTEPSLLIQQHDKMLSSRQVIENEMSIEIPALPYSSEQILSDYNAAFSKEMGKRSHLESALQNLNEDISRLENFPEYTNERTAYERVTIDKGTLPAIGFIYVLGALVLNICLSVINGSSKRRELSELEAKFKGVTH